jgi:ribosomal protein S18 acetylase RimI-like enzyme
VTAFLHRPRHAEPATVAQLLCELGVVPHDPRVLGEVAAGGRLQRDLRRLVLQRAQFVGKSEVHGACQHTAVHIRAIEPDEYARLGALTVEAYTTLEGHVPEPDYEEELYDVRSRAEAPATEVYVAVDDEGQLLGGVTFVVDTSSPFAEVDSPGASSIRMLAVDPRLQRSGAGEALVRRCIERARECGRAQIVLHSTPWMRGAHALYTKLGFERDESLDWDVNPAIALIGFRLTL